MMGPPRPWPSHHGAARPPLKILAAALLVGGWLGRAAGASGAAPRCCSAGTSGGPSSSLSPPQSDTVVVAGGSHTPPLQYNPDGAHVWALDCHCDPELWRARLHFNALGGCGLRGGLDPGGGGLALWGWQGAACLRAPLPARCQPTCCVWQAAGPASVEGPRGAPSSTAPALCYWGSGSMRVDGLPSMPP